LVIPSLDPQRLAAFWCEVLGFLADPEGNEFCLLRTRLS
jgi:hypothetical protein